MNPIYDDNDNDDDDDGKKWQKCPLAIYVLIWEKKISYRHKKIFFFASLKSIKMIWMTNDDDEWILIANHE